MSSDQVPIIPPLPSIPPSPAQEVSRGVATASPISDLSYRSYEGPLKTRYSRWWVVAQAGLRQSFSQPLLYVLFGLPLLRFLIAGFQIYFVTKLVPNGQNLPNFPGEPEGQKFANLFWSAMCGDFNALLMMVIAVAIGAGSIAADNRSNALLVYLAKPIGKTDYLIGKWLNLFLTILFARRFQFFCSISSARSAIEIPVSSKTNPGWVPGCCWGYSFPPRFTPAFSSDFLHGRNPPELWVRSTLVSISLAESSQESSAGYSIQTTK